MNHSWHTVVFVQLIVWLIIIFERKNIKNISKTDKATFISLLMVSTLLSFINLQALPGPLTLLTYIFGAFGTLMQAR